MKFISASPHPALRRYINRYTSLELSRTSREKYFPDGDYRLPDSCARISFHFSVQPPWIEKNQLKLSQPKYNARGIQMEPVRFNTLEEAQVFSVEFTPPGFFFLSGIPCSALGVMPTDLSAIKPAGYRFLSELLEGRTSFIEKVHFLDLFYLEMLSRQSPDTKAFALFDWMKNAQKTVTVEELSQVVFCSERNLRRHFNNWYGASPKQMLRLIRFERAVREMKMNPDRKIVETALEAGYYDQAHFSNDVKHFSGMTPAELKISLLKQNNPPLTFSP